MKRNDWLLLVAVSFYSFLFYQQSAGINYVIFNLVLLGCLAIKDLQVTTSKKWVLVALGCLASALCVGYHGNELSVVANIISLSLLAGLSIDKNSSVIVSLLTALCSYFASPVYWVIDSIERKFKSNSSGNLMRKIFLVGVPILITVIFFFMYRASNALFDDLASKINLDFISIDWIVFTLVGALVLYGFFFIRKITALSNWDEKPGTLLPGSYPTLRLFERNIELKEENFSGTILFVLLNILLLIVNLGDINFLFITHTLPAGITYSAFVHQGIDALIVSIILAIAIVLFYFRGGLNFFEKNKTIKVFAVAWVIQNGFMIFSTACRNARYIDEYGLTFKRIGVYVYLTLAFIGLFTTLIKIAKVKSNNFLFRANGWVVYGFLIVLSFPNWDRIVTGYNIDHGKIDREGYLFTLNYSNIPQLLPLYQKLTATKSEPINVQQDIDWGYSESAYCKNLYNYLAEHDTLDWMSWNYDDADTYNAVTQNNFIDSITDFDLTGIPFRVRGNISNISLKYLAKFKKIKHLNLTQCKVTNLADLANFPNLKKLDIGFERLNNPDEIFKLSNLEELDLSGTQITNISGIEKLTNLKELKLIADYIYDYSPLYKLKNLKTLTLYNASVQDSAFAEICRNLPNTKVVKS